MAKDIKKTITRARWGSVALILIGVVLLVNPDFGSAMVAKVLGWGLVALAGICLAAGVLTWPGMGFGTLGGSCAGLLLGIYILRNPLSLASILGMMLGIFLTVQGIGALADALRLRRNDQGWLGPIILAAATLILGLVLLFSPLTTSRLVMIIAGIVMIVCGVGNLVTHFRASRYIEGKGGAGSVIDADD